MVTRKVQDRQKKIKKMLLKRPWNEKELSETFGCTVKTIKRDIHALEEAGYCFIRKNKTIQLLQQHFVEKKKDEDLSFYDVARYFYLLFLINDRRVSYEELREKTSPQHGQMRTMDETFEDDKQYYKIFIEERSLRRYLRHLLREDYIREERGFYYPGKKMLPCLPLGRQNIVELVSLLREYEGFSPYKTSLERIRGKLLAVYPEREAVLENDRLQRRMERTLYHGKPFLEDYRLARLREEVEKAIRNRLRIIMLYETAGGKITCQTISPLALCYNRFSDLWHIYILPLDRQGFPQVRRLDRICKLNITGSHYLVPEGLDINALIEPGWGVRVGPPQRVKILITEKFNILQKIRSQIRGRSKARLYPQQDNSWIYEDEIRSLDEFRSWLRQIGYAAEVLEPPSYEKKSFDQPGAPLSVTAKRQRA